MGRPAPAPPLNPPSPLNSSGSNPVLLSLRRFLIATNPDDRKVIWFVNESGARGKSKFVKWMICNMGACLLANDRRSDACKWDGQKICILDVPRAQFFKAYDSVECLKDGIIVKEKYEVEDKVDAEQPFVLIFSNYWPDENRRPALRSAGWGRGLGRGRSGPPVNQPVAQVDKRPRAHHPPGDRG